MLASLTAAAALLAGCSTGQADPAPSGDASGSSSTPSATASPSGRYARYVALGDSFSAGPLIPLTDLAGGCARSDHNYPSLVAKRLGVGRFVDVTCSGATTRDLTRPQHPYQDSTIPPQLDAVTRRTDLVTIGIGGNDLDLFATLVGTCTRLARTDPTGAPCARSLAAGNGPDLAAATRTISRNVTTALREIRVKAPRATVLLVGYLRLVPDRGTCPALPLAAGDYAEGRRISEGLDRALRQAARRTGVRFVDAYALSKGHDICSQNPWVNGRLTQRDKALAYHPFASGMRAVAGAVLADLTR